MTEAEKQELKRNFFKMLGDGHSVEEIFVAIEPLITASNRKAWYAGRDAACRVVESYRKPLIIREIENLQLYD